ncbi:MAG: hydantoinase B/oxoprolinase family protein [Actinobacteria bacterium]|nr:hydantoinase B/oxoprolinase family protein [Actinomycetota bacterium]
MSATRTDPVTQEVLAAAFRGIADEMSIVEYRASFSPIIREMFDFNCGLFDREGAMIAHSEQIPAQLGLMQFALKAIIERWGESRIAAGDALILNDPYLGGTHTPDLQIFTPIFVAGQLVGWSGSIAHHIDIGGRVPGTVSAHNTEIFQEGLIFPGIKLVAAGERNEAVFELIAANVRDPAATLSDIDAQLAACRRGVERIEALCGRYGVETVVAAMPRLLELNAARARASFARWPRETVRAEGLMDDGGFPDLEPAAIRVAISVEGDRLLIDLGGTDPQLESSINVPYSSTHAAALFAVRCFVDGLSQSVGLDDAVRLVVPAGSVLNPRRPAGVSGRHLTVQRLADVLVDALGKLVPERAIAGSQVAFPALVFQADDEDGRRTLFTDILGGGGGARPDRDGDDAIDTYTGNIALFSAELTELEYPWRIESTRLVDGSGGGGRFRGGAAIRRDYRLLGTRGEGTYYVEQTREHAAPGGRDGGSPGATAKVTVKRAGSEVEEALPSKGYVNLRQGDLVSFVSSGGGGYGAAPEADPAAPATENGPRDGV